MSVNVPATIWHDQSGLVEYGSDGPNDIVDTADEHLVDTAGIQIVDTGVTATLIPATVWQEDDSL